jgi:hypothetical protein
MFYWKLNHNYSIIPTNQIKTTNKICGISKTKFVIFYYKVPTTPLTLPKNCVFKNPLPSSQIYPFWAVPNHIIMVPKTTKIQNSNQQCSMINPNALFIQTMYSSYPLNTYFFKHEIFRINLFLSFQKTCPIFVFSKKILSIPYRKVIFSRL